ncbi:MAG TPA: hypothetical protein VIE63_03395 [Ramlibacter sp.]|jgi:hypothetical protein
MALAVTVQREADLLVVVGQGRATLADLKGFADLVATICTDEQRPRALVDLLEVEQDLAFTDHIQLGVYIADKLGFLQKMATVVPARYRTGNSERAAQKSGLKLRTFLSLAEARDWLDDAGG